jgi:hypothetical protein
MTHKWLVVGIILAGLLFCLLGHAVPAAAQEPTPGNDENCVACHTHQYYLYDSGKYFCLCEAPMHCVYCHGGRTDTLDKTLAHEGLVLYPTHEHARRCQSCHTEDYLDRVVTFGAVAGINPTSQPAPTATVNAAALAEVAALPPQSLLRLDYLEPWRLAGLAAFTLVLLLIVVFGYRCYKADCLMRARG